MTEFDDKQARKLQAKQEKLKAADAALKAALAERVKLGVEVARHELYDFATWVPGSFPSNWNAVMGRRMTAAEHAEVRDAPFISEAYLYHLMGKEEARMVMGMFDCVCRALGIEGGYHELQEPWWRAKEEDRRKRIDNLVHLRECRIGEGHTLSDDECEKCCARYEKSRYKFDRKEGCAYKRNLERIRELMDEDEWREFKKRKEFKKPRKKSAKAKV